MSDVAARFTALVESLGACNTQAQAARIVGMPGKSFRDITRDKLGLYVSRDGSWGPTHAAAWANTGRGRRAIARHLGVSVDALPPVTPDGETTGGTTRDYSAAR